MKNLTIFCSSKNGLKEDYIQITRDLIRKIDICKYTIVYGGSSIGLMGEVRNTFINNGGKIISSNLQRFVENDENDDYIFDYISDRQSKLIDLADILLLLPGGFGSMYECLETITKNQICEISKPIIIFNYNHIYDHFLKQIIVLQEEGFIKNTLESYNVVVFTNIDDIIEYLKY